MDKKNNYQNGSETKELILQTAAKLFYENGYEFTTYNDICDAAHINRGLIHYHYKSKEAIRDLVFDKESQKIYAQIDALDLRIHQYEKDILLEFLYWYKFFNDSKYRRFNVNVLSNEEKNNSYGAQFTYLVESVDKLPPKAELNIAFLSGMQSTLAKYVSYNMNRFTYTDVAEFESEMLFARNGNSREYLQEKILSIKSFIQKIDMNMFSSDFSEKLFNEGYNIKDMNLDALYNTHQIKKTKNKGNKGQNASNTQENVSEMRYASDGTQAFEIFRNESILDFCTKPKSREEIQSFIGLKNREYFRKSVLKPLIDSGRLLRTDENNPKNRNQKYYTNQELL